MDISVVVDGREVLWTNDDSPSSFVPGHRGFFPELPLLPLRGVLKLLLRRLIMNQLIFMG